MSTYPPVFQVATQSAQVRTALGNGPTRLWPFGRAPQSGQPGYGVPYAVHQLIVGSPVHSLDCPPTMDNFSVQVDCYGASATEADTAATALRDAFEAAHLVVEWNASGWDQPTGLYRVSFTVEFWTDRYAS